MEKFIKVLLTGAAGFIGFSLAKTLINNNVKVIGIDNINDYYSIKLKFDRLDELGISKQNIYENKATISTKYSNLSFYKTDISNFEMLNEIIKREEINIVVHLAAQAGVRYSIENPDSYIQNNIVGFYNVLESCRHNKISKLIYASSSSVYGNNKKIPFHENDNVDFPVSLYAASKKSNELMAHSYSHLYNIQTIGLRFFTVYGEWGRPDMAYFKFAKNILNNKPIEVFNNGDLERDFTYIDDIIQGIMNVIHIENKEKYSIYNIGNSNPIKLLDFIEYLEMFLNKKSMKILKPMQAGDVYRTFADVSKLIKDYNYNPETQLRDGIKKFVEWFMSYHKY